MEGGRGEIKSPERGGSLCFDRGRGIPTQLIVGEEERGRPEPFR